MDQDSTQLLFNNDSLHNQSYNPEQMLSHPQQHPQSSQNLSTMMSYLYSRQIKIQQMQAVTDQQLNEKLSNLELQNKRFAQSLNSKLKDSLAGMTKMKEMLKKQEELVQAYEREINQQRPVTRQQFITLETTDQEQEEEDKNELTAPLQIVNNNQSNLLQIASDGSATSNNPLIQQIKQQLGNLNLESNQNQGHHNEQQQDLTIKTSLIDQAQIKSPFIDCVKIGAKQQILAFTRCENKKKQWSSFISIMDERSFGPDRTIEMKVPASKKYQNNPNPSVRWIMQMGNKYTVVQLQNQTYDVITYINFVRQDPPQVWHTFIPFLKPEIIEFYDGIYCLVFASASNGDVRYMNYNERDGFQKSSTNKPYSLKPRTYSNDNANRSMHNDSKGQIMNQSMNQSLIEYEEHEPMITCFKVLQRSKLLGIALHPDIGGGLVTLQLDPRQSRFYGYLNFNVDQVLREITPHEQRQSDTGCKLSSVIADFIEISDTKILVLTRSQPQFIYIDLEIAWNRGPKFACKLLDGGGMGNLGLSLTLMPGYNEKKYPFVICKEDTHIYILEPFKNYSQSLINHSMHKVSPLSSNDALFFEHYHQMMILSDASKIFFDSEQPNLFYTVIPNEYGTEDTGGRYDLAKFQIDPVGLKQFVSQKF